jgi:hypothetical protein
MSYDADGSFPAPLSDSVALLLILSCLYPGAKKVPKEMGEQMERKKEAADKRMSSQGAGTS